MAVDWDLAIKVAGPVLGAVAGAAAKDYFEKKPRVVAFLQHAAGIPVPNTNPPVTVGTHTVVLRNTGKKAATNVRLGHATLPTFNVVPQMQYTVSALPGGQQEIVLPLLIPDKQVTITYLYGAPLQWQNVNTHLEHDEGPVRVISVLPSVQYPKWVSRALWALTGVGLVTVLYFVVQLAGWLYERA